MVRRWLCIHGNGPGKINKKGKGCAMSDRIEGFLPEPHVWKGEGGPTDPPFRSAFRLSADVGFTAFLAPNM